MEAERSTRDPDAPREPSLGAEPSKPRAAASLTADIVERGRHRTQEYGEAGLWRGAQAPAPAEAPIRVDFPRSPDPEIARAPEAAPQETPERVETPDAGPSPLEAKPVPEMVPVLLFSLAFFLAAFLLGLLFFVFF